jgi:hypothetical protein
LINHPFLIYNSVYNNHFTIQYAEDIVSCELKKDECDDFIKNIKTDPMNDYKEIYAVKFSSLDLQHDFFSRTSTLQNLSKNCHLKSWGNGKQTDEEYFFPTKAYSIFQNGDSGDLAGSEDLNVLHLSHYYTSIGMNKNGAGLLAAVPIDIIRYMVEESEDGKIKKLVAQLWHPVETLKKTKISKLNGPFVVTRKLGSSELGLWYNPMSSKTKVNP